jgi:hypothetical protein
MISATNLPQNKKQIEGYVPTSLHTHVLDIVKYVENTLSKYVQTTEYRFISTHLYQLTELKGREKKIKKRETDSLSKCFITSFCS